jgi:hypothetical protein
MSLRSWATDSTAARMTSVTRSGWLKTFESVPTVIVPVRRPRPRGRGCGFRRLDADQEPFSERQGPFARLTPSFYASRPAPSPSDISG